MRYLLCVLGVMTAFILAGGWAIRYDDVLRQRRAANLYSWAASWRGMTRSCFQWLQYWPVVPELRLARCLVVLYGLGVALIWQACWSSALSVWAFPFWWFGLVVILAMLSLTDLQSRLLPDVWVLSLAGWLLLGRWGAMFLYTCLPIWHVLLLMTTMALVYCALLRSSIHRRFGAGDLKLIAVLVLGCGSFEQWFAIIFIACLLCIATQALWQQRLYPTGQCAFGPYLCFAFIMQQHPFWSTALLQNMGF